MSNKGTTPCLSPDNKEVLNQNLIEYIWREKWTYVAYVSGKGLMYMHW